MKTELYGLRIGQCENQAEYEKLVREHQSLYRQWQDFVGPMITDKGLKYTHIANGCGVNRVTAKNFSTHIPVKRENVIMLAMMLGMNEEQTNELLMRYAKFERLYPKNPGDAIWIYLLRHGGSQEPKKLFTQYYDRYKKLEKEYLEEECAGGVAIDTFFANQEIPTGNNKALLDPEKDLVFEAMVRRLLPSFQSGYVKLMDYIEEKLCVEDMYDYKIRQRKPAEVFRGKEDFLSRYYRVIANLRKRHELPSRIFLIALGIHLKLDTDGINNMLELAGMGPLCPKDRLEGSVAFYLEELYCQMPSTFLPGALEIDPIVDQLVDKWETGTDEDELFAAPIECLPDYIKRRLMETNILGVEGDQSIQELLQML